MLKYIIYSIKQREHVYLPGSIIFFPLSFENDTVTSCFPWLTWGFRLWKEKNNNIWRILISKGLIWFINSSFNCFDIVVFFVKSQGIFDRDLSFLCYLLPWKQNNGPEDKLNQLLSFRGQNRRLYELKNKDHTIKKLLQCMLLPKVLNLFSRMPSVCNTIERKTMKNCRWPSYKPYKPVLITNCFSSRFQCGPSIFVALINVHFAGSLSHYHTEESQSES